MSGAENGYEKREVTALEDGGANRSRGHPTVTLPERPAFNQKAFDENYHLIVHKKKGVLETVKDISDKHGLWTKQYWWNFTKSRFPILDWLPKYQWKTSLPGDIIAGTTVAILHVSLGMAIALLARVPPITGLYVAFFASIVYILMGTSRHLVIAGGAVVSIMIGEVVQRQLHLTSGDAQQVIQRGHQVQDNTTDGTDTVPCVGALDIATTLSMTVGITQMLTGFLQLGGLAVYLSDTMVSGFLSGACVHVLVSQLENLLGVTLPYVSSPFRLFKVVIGVFERISVCNVPTVVVSAVSITVLVSVKIAASRYLKAMPIPLPIEIAVILIATLVSHCVDFESTYNVAIVGYIPTGLPAVDVPEIHLVPSVLVDGIIIAIVTYTLTLSFGLFFAKNHGYRINSNQELLALGCANLLGSFFSCMTCCVAISRTMTQEASGGKSLVSNAVSAFIVLGTILVIGPIFRSLPVCVLSSILVVVLKNMIGQLKQLKLAWVISPLEASLWIVAFLAVLLLDVGIGLGVGFLYSIVVVVVRTQWPYSSLLGRVPGTDIYLDTKKYQAAEEVGGIRIFHFSSFLYFVNKEYFKSELYRLVGVNPSIPEATTGGHISLQMQASRDGGYGTVGCSPSSKTDSKMAPKLRFDKCNNETAIHHIIIDASGWSYIDLPGIEALQQVVEDFAMLGVTVYIAACHGTVSERIERHNFFKNGLKTLMFPTIHDAMAYAECVSQTTSS